MSTLIAVLVAVTGCASDGPGDANDGPASATIRTTSTSAGTTANETATTETATTGTVTNGSVTNGTITNDTSTTASPTPTASGPPPSAGATAPIVTTSPDNQTPPSTGSVTVPPPRVADPAVTSELVGEFDEPIDLAVRPGDDALWIVQQGGRVVRFDGAGSATVLDLSGRINSGGERGLLGLVFDPTGSRAYVNFTDRNDDTVIAGYAVGADGTIDPSTERVVLEVDQPYGNHNAGDLAFGPDGMLYIPLGDGGSGGDPQRNASNPATLLGSILRIDPTPGDELPYTVPPDNPFVGGGSFAGVSGAPEVWAWGVRNPWKIAFDPVTDELWVPDVGQNEFEEINVAAPTESAPAGRGADFGWSAFEGNERFNDDVPDPGRTTPPVLTYRHSDGCSISGGVPYRGRAIAELAPAFVYSDYCTGTIWALDLAGSRNLTLLEGFSDVAAVRAGPDDELYVLERSGSVYRLVPG